MPPDFLIVGAPRSGTSSLNHYLRQHPEIHMARGKELHLFDKKWDRGIEWYRGQFHPDPGQLSGESHSLVYVRSSGARSNWTNSAGNPPHRRPAKPNRSDLLTLSDATRGRSRTPKVRRSDG